MIKIAKISSSLPFLFNLLLVCSISACNEAKTSSDAPSSTESSAPVSTKNDQATKDDAQSDTRKKQLNADIRAREQRNNVAGNPQKRTQGDLASEVRSKLEANIPNGKLTILANDAQVTVSGTVKTQEQLDKIKPLAMEIKGVDSVMVKAVITP
jgi:hyperosmotically inducible periplasmic protein